MSKTQTTNHLIHETSPYLLQHAHNPVDWYPWGEEAFQKAKQEDKPILLSCGYSACHWCHVMERESFENPEIAEMMNSYFVNIKVDREERPDIDQIYQQAVQTLTGQGGWPLTAFLDTDGKPFFGGTYFPPTPMYGRNSFPQMLETLHQKWLLEKDKIKLAGEELYQYIYDGGLKAVFKQTIPSLELPVTATKKLLRYFDQEYGGFDHAPKFPNPTALQLLLACGVLNRQNDALEAALFTLEQMARGGMYDHLGGGFHRYSTDRYWLVPHFEKMLYDNAQLLKLYTIGYQLRQSPEFKKVIFETADYLRREMTHPEGGFYATQDADSEGEEGRYYVWSMDEVNALLTIEESKQIIHHFNIMAEGNFEGKNILNRSREAKIENNIELTADNPILESAKHKLFVAREKRVKPFRDEKIITSWNGLAISGLAYAYQVFRREEDYHSAKRAAEFLLKKVRLSNETLARIYKEEAKVEAMLDDFTFLVQGLLDLYEADFNPEWLAESIELTSEVMKRFRNEDGYYYLVSIHGEQLVTRPLSRYDQAIPSGVSVHVNNLLRLAVYTGNIELRQEAEKIFTAYAGEFELELWGFASFIYQLNLYNHGMREFVFLSEAEPPELLLKMRQQYIPNRVLAWCNPEAVNLTAHPARDLFQERSILNGEPTCYICSNQQCQPPLTKWKELQNYLN